MNASFEIETLKTKKQQLAAGRIPQNQFLVERGCNGSSLVWSTKMRQGFRFLNPSSVQIVQ